MIIRAPALRAVAPAPKVFCILSTPPLRGRTATNRPYPAIPFAAGVRTMQKIISRAHKSKMQNTFRLFSPAVKIRSGRLFPGVGLGVAGRKAVR
jgi:hypothetical protein